jgi:hypothetical protein
VKFRRKEQESAESVDDAEGTDLAADAPETGPYDSEELPPSELDRVDLGSLLIAPEPDRELRIQVDEANGVVQSVVIAGPDGAVELRAFAAPRNGDLWAEARPQIAAEVAQSGGTATEREGPWGTELICQVSQRTGAPQVTRVVGINGARWMLRASLLGQPAVAPDQSQAWEDSIRKIVVHRGGHAMPVGEALPIVMPAQARRLDPPSQ